jgi:hypothetical protein
VLPVIVLLWLYAGADTASGYSESPKETMVAWYQALMENYEALTAVGLEMLLVTVSTAPITFPSMSWRREAFFSTCT